MGNYDRSNLDRKTSVFITGAAGFIGFHLSRSLLEDGVTVLGLDNMNAYYDVGLKESRLEILREYENFHFAQESLENAATIEMLFVHYAPDVVINLAAQAGVRYSIENPKAYIDSNIVGFFNVLEACRHHRVRHLIYASSSSVYGDQQKTPYSETDHTNCPVSLYAATKKADEAMAYAYSQLYHIPITGLRFFTVYGPYGRPDMAYFSFAKKILAGDAIQVYNFGDLYRDFTYIDDIIKGIRLVMQNPSKKLTTPHRLYNIGNHKPEHLLYFIETLEKCLGIPAYKELLPMQAGDVYRTYADITAMKRDFNFSPSVNIEEGLARFASWFKQYYANERRESV